MEAGEGIFCLGKVAHQRGHLVAAERIAGFDRRLARGGDREAFQQRLGGGRLPPLGQLSDQVGKHTLGRRPHGNLRDGTNQHGPVAKWLEVEAQLRQEGLMRGKESKCVRLQGQRRGCDLHLPVGRAPPPRARRSTAPKTCCSSSNRTSRFRGWTLTSTRCGGASRKITNAAYRPPGRSCW